MRSRSWITVGKWTDDKAACADHTIRIFSTSGQLLNTLKGSKDVVRALCRLPDKNAWGAQFASAGNDAVIRLWTMGGKQVAQLEGHDSFIYSLTLLPTGELVSSGEDRTVKVWRDRDCIQTITHPATSVWTVAVCAETGDIASGASDRIVRIFSRSPERHANKETIEVFNASVEGSSIPKQTVGNGDIKKDNLPGPDFLKKKVGTREGQVQMILQYNGNVTAHTWSHMAQEWINVGTVVDAAGSTGRRQEYMGQDYDYVFDIDVAEGQPPLKLPYNSSDNPYEVARKFIADHELPTGYVDQVSNFIITNTQSTSFDQQSTTQTPQPAPSTRPKVLPQKEYSTITTANFGIISRKIQELNAQLLSSGKKDMAFSPSDLKLIPDFISALESALAATSSSSTSLSPSQTQTLDTGAVLLTKIITAWPHAMRIPGLDLYRCLTACHPPTDTLATLKASGAFPFHAPADSPSNPNMLMLALRALANLFATDAGRHIAQQNGEGNVSEALELVAPCVEPASAGANNRNVHIAATTFCVNYAVLLLSSSSSSATSAETPSSNTNDTSVTITTTTTKTTPEASTARTLLSPLSSLLSSPKVLDSETIYRALVAVGTLARVPGAKDEELSKLLGEAVAAAGKRCKEPRVAGVVGEILV